MVSAGIDLGTTNSCVAVYTDNGVEVLINELGKRTTPSYVLLLDNNDVVGEEVVGEAAKESPSKHSESVIYDSKRMIGKSFSDPVLQDDIKRWPFLVKNDGYDAPQIEVSKFKNGIKQFSPEEISSFILKKMKKIVEEQYLGQGKTLTEAVITIPAYFNDDQREATKTAAKKAGLKVLRLVSEPSAAGFAYCYHRLKERNSHGRILLVYDLGGGTFDVSLMKIINGDIEVIAVSGDTHLGGNDFDARLIDFCVKKFMELTGEDVSNNKRAQWKLRITCVKAKEHLSSNHQYEMEIDALQMEKNFDYTIRRSDLETACQDLFDKTMKIVQNVLTDANILPTEVDEVLLVGGSSRIPKLQEMLTTKFGEKKLTKSINGDEAVAYGAAIQAAIIKGEIKQECNIKLVEVTSHSIQISTTTGCFTMIPRNTKYPTKQVNMFFTPTANKVRIGVYEGESLKEEENHLLGQFILTGDFPALADLEVTYDMDANGMLHVTSKIVSTGKSADMTIDYKRKRTS